MVPLSLGHNVDVVDVDDDEDKDEPQHYYHEHEYEHDEAMDEWDCYCDTPLDICRDPVALVRLPLESYPPLRYR